ncbi:YfhE family protein [Lentibacillus juripiscarius]|uniref:YfhE family protein n=1 Tax=Lentibacillus juripiscarius TaxID=257446 RepID=A0ABW5V6B1_9BACI
MRNTQYQPTQNKQMTDAQEVHFARAFKQADIAGGFRRANSSETK